MYVYAEKTLSSELSLPMQAIDSIGFTTYHTKLFFLNGFGYVGLITNQSNTQHADNLPIAMGLIPYCSSS